VQQSGPISTSEPLSGPGYGGSLWLSFEHWRIELKFHNPSGLVNSVSSGGLLPESSTLLPDKVHPSVFSAIEPQMLLQCYC